VIADVQPSFVPTDMRWVDARVSARWQYDYSYAWKTLMQRGVIVAGGSDSPIEHCNPLVGLYDAMFRRHREDPTSVFRPTECLTWSEALSIYTSGGAYAAGCEGVLGSVQAGFAADIVFLDAAVLANPDLLRTTKPLWVMVGGEIVFSSAATPDQPLAAVPMSGPFVPGKNGLRKLTPFRCLCCK
jgi:predicted amidohydrolase YtcJ